MTKIMLVEDEPLIATSTGFVLEAEGYEVCVALDGREGLEMARTESPDLIITDHLMPRMNGIAMIWAFRGAGLTTPVVLATAVPEARLPADPTGRRPPATTHISESGIAALVCSRWSGSAHKAVGSRRRHRAAELKGCAVPHDVRDQDPVLTRPFTALSTCGAAQYRTGTGAADDDRSMLRVQARFVGQPTKA